MDSIDTMLTDMAATMILEGTIALDDGREREDLMGLYQDIRRELRQKAPEKENIIYSYALSLQKELDRCTPRMAYEAGAVLGCNAQRDDSVPESAFMRYMCRIGRDPAVQHLQNEVRNTYSEILGLLGDTYSLIDDFTVLYRKCNGIINNKIFVFFRLGYDMSRANTAPAM